MDSQQKVIDDFGDQWTSLTENTGYYASVEMLRDILDPLVDTDDLRGKSVCEVGGGTGRIVNILLECGAGHVTVLEPSDAIDVLQHNLHDTRDRVTALRQRGDELEAPNAFDFVFSIGVIHHIPDPAPTLANMYDAVKPGGTAFIWIYGREGNKTYLFFAEKARTVTKVLPDPVLRGISHLLTVALMAYIGLCRVLPLPMRTYMRNVIGKYKYENLFLTVFDQLNPEHAKYYTKDEAEELFRNAGFADVQIFHRDGYSWSVSGTNQLT